MTELPINPDNFENKKTRFFGVVALKLRDVFRVHEIDRLWERNDKGMKDWRNVSEHCLVEAVRVQVLADMVGLGSKTAETLHEAAALHDVNKRLEIEALRGAEVKSESSLTASYDADERKAARLQELGFSERVARIANLGGVSPNQLFIAQEILNKTELTEDDIASLIMHYVDGYTRKSDWVEPVSSDAQGIPKNDIDRRQEQNRNSPAYNKIQLEQTAGLAGHPVLSGKDINEAAAQVLHGIERRLCDLIKKRTEKRIDPLFLPEIVDQAIKHKIEKI